MPNVFWLANLLNFLHPWVGAIAPFLFDTSTALLAVLGGFVAIRPIEKQEVRLRWGSGAMFALFATVAIVANICERNIENGEKDQLRSNETAAINNETAARIKFSNTLEDVENAVKHPAKGLTQDQLASTVQKIIGQQNSERTIPRDRLRIMASASVQQMDECAKKWNDDDRIIQSGIDHENSKLPPNGSEQEAHLAIAKLVARRSMEDQAYSEQIPPMMRNAELIKEELLQGSEETADDKTNDIIFSKSLSGGTLHWNDMRQVAYYMKRLAGRFGLS